ncbi:MAG: hypothetical protein ACTHN5_11730 [Phycisphaerae bacterium]
MPTTPDNPRPHRLAKTAAALALASGTTLLGGCMASHPAPEKAALQNPPPDPPAPLTPQQLAADRIKNYTADINAALDNLDAEKFRKADALPSLNTPTTQPARAQIPPATQPSLAAATTQPAPLAQATTQPAAAPTTQPHLAAAPTTMPAPKPIIVRVQPTYDEALAIVRKRIATRPTLSTTLALALLDTAEGKAPNTALASTLSPADQKILSDLLAALQGMSPTSAAADLPDRAAPLLDAASRWKGDHDLTLPKLALASRVDSFGVYTPVDPRFPQGTARTVILYCEVANFTSRKDPEGQFETKLTQQESLITSDGLLVYRPNPEDVDDRSFNHRHDFYLVKKITLPATLPVGKYTLRMNVTDRLANKIAIVTMPLEITPSDNN